jgi:fructose-1,6-bisphosphatase/inositol monophosphatase family enzyme
MYMAELGQGATRNGVPMRRTRPVPPVSEMRGAVLTRFLDPVTSNHVAAHRARFGSISSGRLCAGVDYPALIEGEQEFVLFWRTLPWDHAPGALLLNESGGVACRVDGTPYGPTQQMSGLLAAATPAAWDSVRTTLLGPYCPPATNRSAKSEQPEQSWPSSCPIAMLGGKPAPA